MKIKINGSHCYVPVGGEGSHPTRHYPRAQAACSGRPRFCTAYNTE